MTEQLDMFASKKEENKIELFCYKYNMKLFQLSTCSICEHKNSEKQNELVYMKHRGANVNAACLHPLKNKCK